MLNPQNIFFELIGVEYYFWTMKVYPITLQELKKKTTISLVLSTRKRFLWLSVCHGKSTIEYYCLADKISKIELNQPNMLLFWLLYYISIRWIKKIYVFMKFHFKLKCKEFPYRLSMCTVLKKFNLALLKVVKYIESFLPWATFDLWNGTKVLIVFFS